MKIQKKSLVAVLAGVVGAGALGASATTLGGITSGALGADKATVAAPVSKGVTVGWNTAYNAGAGAYVLDGVTLKAADSTETIPARAQVHLAVTGATGLLGEYVSTDGGATWTRPSQAVLAEKVTGVAVAINGTSVPVQG